MSILENTIPSIVESFEKRVEEIKKANPFPKRSGKSKKVRR